MATATKKPKPKRARTPKAKQGVLNGMEEPVIQAIEDAAETYDDVKRERCVLSKDEKEAKESLTEAMLTAGRTHYITQTGIIVDATQKTNVKTKRKKADGSEETDQEAGEE